MSEGPRTPPSTWTDKDQPYLSLKTTPSIQAPKKTTLEMSEHEVQVERRHEGHLSLTEHKGRLMVHLVSRIQMKEVVRIAMMVPMGMDLWASRRSPDLLEPAIIPETNKMGRT